MSLFGSLMGDVEEDQFFGSHMRHMRQMNNMMNSMMSSMFSDPFGALGGGGPLSITCPRPSGALMPFMPQMPSLNRLFSADLDGHGHMSAGHSYSSSTVFMSSGPHGKPQVISSSSSTKIGPNGIKETRKTLQDSRTGTKKMSIGHHIGERAHLIEREQNVYSGDAEERQEFINLDEEEAEDFDREFQQKAGSSSARAAIAAPRRAPPRLALPAPPAPPAHTSVSEDRRVRPSARRPLRTAASPLTTHSSSVRDVYGSAAPMCPRRNNSKPSHASHRPTGDH